MNKIFEAEIVKVNKSEKELTIKKVDDKHEIINIENFSNFESKCSSALSKKTQFLEKNGKIYHLWAVDFQKYLGGHSLTSKKMHIFVFSFFIFCFDFFFVFSSVIFAFLLMAFLHGKDIPTSLWLTDISTLVLTYSVAKVNKIFCKQVIEQNQLVIDCKEEFKDFINKKI